MRNLALPLALSTLMAAGCVAGSPYAPLNAAAGVSLDSTPAARISSAPDQAPGARLILKAASDLQAQAAVEAVGGRLVRRIDGLDAWVAEVAASDANASCAAIAAAPGIIYAEPDEETEPAGELAPNDLQIDQDALRRLNAPAAWAVAKGQDVRIAVLDTGVDLSHEDLQGKIVMTANFSTSPTLADHDGHGTHVAGIAAAQTDNGVGIAGAGHSAVLMIGKVLGDDAKGSTAALVDGVVWAANQGAKVINISVSSKKPSVALEDAIEFAWRKNVLVVAAAGNKRGAAKVYPAAFRRVLAVTAVDHDDKIARDSGQGKWVDVAAPGEAIYSTLPGQRYGAMSGTSAAAPLVAGQAALIWSALGPDATAEQVRARIEGSCTDVKSLAHKVRHGLVDFARALAPEAAPL